MKTAYVEIQKLATWLVPTFINSDLSKGMVDVIAYEINKLDRSDVSEALKLFESRSDIDVRTHLNVS